VPHRFTSRLDGDTRPRDRNPEWAIVHQVHGAGVVLADHPGFLGEGDAIVTTTPGLEVAVRVADCCPIALLGDGVVAVVHAGWRGLAAGVISATLDVMSAHGAGEIEAVLGPCIHAECYEFGEVDLDAVAEALGDAVRATTSWGTPALDLQAAVRAQLPNVEDVDVCTSCSTEHWSHRARGDVERHAVVAWI
jgi:hypothetical protein